MTADTISQISSLLGEPITEYRSLSGGDISSLYYIQTPSRSLVLKMQRGPHATKMLEAEEQGLAEIAATKTIKVPVVHHHLKLDSASILVMDYIENRSPNTSDYTHLGLQLARLHQHTADTFGWSQNNFIGRLPQSNPPQQDWTAFYVNQRLLPQVAMAKNQNLLSEKEIPSQQQLLDRCKALFPSQIKPSLLHGDLWSGNYLIAMHGAPYLIDPSVYYGHSEVDLAMSRLFGGFGPAFYEAYHTIIPREEKWEARVDMYQLYYLLVHLNMFGASYRSSVLRILNA